MTTKSYNCANQIGPGTDSTAFQTNGAMLVGPGSEQGFLLNGPGVTNTLGAGTYTILKLGSFGFASTSSTSVPNPLPMTNNLTAINISTPCTLPVNPNFGDTYRFIGNSITPGVSVIQMGSVNQRAYLNGNRTSGGGTLTANSADCNITLVCCLNTGGGAVVAYVCYDVQGSWTLG